MIIFPKQHQNYQYDNVKIMFKTGCWIYLFGPEGWPRHYFALSPSNPEIIKEFQQAIKDDYNQDISLAEAERMLSDLVGFFDKLEEIHHRDVIEKSAIIN